MFARQSLKLWKPRSSRSARYGIVPPRWQSAQRIFGKRSGTPLKTSDAAASVVSKQEADQRHQPVLLHHVDVHRVRRMDVEHRAAVVRRLVDRPEALVAERHAVDVAEQHRAAHAELAGRALEFLQRRRRIVERQRRQRGEVLPARVDRLLELVVHHRRQPHRRRRRLDVRPRRRQRDDLHRHAVLVEHLLRGTRDRDGRAPRRCSRPG